MLVIPAIDLLDGKVVRLKKGDYEQVTVYHEDPLEQAREFLDAGFSHLHIVDLNGAREGRFVNLGLIQRIVDDLCLSVQTGGGIRSIQDVHRLMENGISRIVCTSMAVKNERDWLRALDIYGERCILGMDLKDGQIAYSGWTETADESVDEFLGRMEKEGLQDVLCTDISRDGTMQGVNTELYRDLMHKFPNINFTASGGVAGEEDLKALHDIDMHSVVVGRSYYEGKLTLKQMQKYHTENQPKYVY